MINSITKVAVQEDSNEDAEEMEIQDSTEEDFNCWYSATAFSESPSENRSTSVTLSTSLSDAALSSKYSLFRRNAYYMDSSDASVVFDGSGNGILTNGDIITIKNPSYQDLLLRVKGSGSALSKYPFNLTYNVFCPSDGPSLSFPLFGS